MSDRITGSVTMVIPNFSKLTSFNRTSFKIDNGFEIYFGINPKTSVYKNEEFVSVYLQNHSMNKPFEFQYKVSILNVKGEKLFIKEYSGEFKNFKTQNYGNLMSRSEILSYTNGYLYYDMLTLHCELEVIKKIEAIDPNAIIITLNNDLNSLSEEFRSLLKDDKYSDFTLVVGEDGKEFQVHKNILEARSPVFAAMFEHDCEEKRQNKVNITDMDEEVCGEMLSYVYTGKVKELDRYAMELLVVADKYQLPSLKSICSEYMCNHLSVESVANVLILADLHQATKLKPKCFEYICANVDQVETTEGWKVLGTKGPLLQELFIYLAKKK